MSEDVLRNLEKRTYGTGAMSVFDILGAQQVGQSVSRQRPEKFLEGLGTFGIGSGVKWFRNPNRKVKTMFEAAKRDVGSDRLREPVLGATTPRPIPEPIAPAPTSTPAVKSKGERSISANKFAEQFGVTVEEAARILDENTKGIPRMKSGGLVGLKEKYNL